MISVSLKINRPWTDTERSDVTLRSHSKLAGSCDILKKCTELDVMRCGFGFELCPFWMSV